MSDGYQITIVTFPGGIEVTPHPQGTLHSFFWRVMHAGGRGPSWNGLHESHATANRAAIEWLVACTKELHWVEQEEMDPLTCRLPEGTPCTLGQQARCYQPLMRRSRP
ncbi:MAG: hypothetical protein NVS4B8_27630 [Herpetosiphon sp.]